MRQIGIQQSGANAEMGLHFSICFLLVLDRASAVVVSAALKVQLIVYFMGSMLPRYS